MPYNSEKNMGTNGDPNLHLLHQLKWRISLESKGSLPVCQNGSQNNHQGQRHRQLLQFLLKYGLFVLMVKDFFFLACFCLAGIERSSFVATHDLQQCSPLSWVNSDPSAFVGSTCLCTSMLSRMTTCCVYLCGVTMRWTHSWSAWLISC